MPGTLLWSSYAGVKCENQIVNLSVLHTSLTAQPGTYCENPDNATLKITSCLHIFKENNKAHLKSHA